MVPKEISPHCAFRIHKSFYSLTKTSGVAYTLEGSLMKNTRLVGLLLICIALTSAIVPFVSAESLEKDDFEKESFAKTIDFYDYVRAYASLHGVQTPEGFENWHANMYMTYVNKSGLQLLYAGLEDVTTDESTYLRIPMQSFIMHYKTNEQKRDVILASTFLMLMAYNETASTTEIANSPDTSDLLYASFSLGFDLSSLGKTLPVLNSKTDAIPLASSNGGLEWTWGMKYTNLTALWWRTWIDPENPHFDNSWPLALTVYDELTFKYSLRIDPSAGTAVLSEDHVIGRMRHLFVGLIPFAWVYYNSTASYGMLGRKLSDDTIYDYIDDNELKMSIISLQTSITADHETYTATQDGQNVADSEITVSDGSVATYIDDGEKISQTDFGTKRTYRLYDYVANPDEETFSEYQSTARTAAIPGFAGNGGLFANHIGLMRFLPLVVVHMYPALFQKAVSTISDMSRANYFCIVAYPEYGGFRIEHDPVITAYIAAEQNNIGGAGGLFLLLTLIAVVAAIVAIVVLVRRTKRP